LKRLFETAKEPAPQSPTAVDAEPSGLSQALPIRLGEGPGPASPLARGFLASSQRD